MKRVCIILLGLLLSLPVAAQPKWGVGLLFGPEGEIEVDKVSSGGETFNGDKEDTKEKIATVRKCGHTFHLACVQQWWAQHNNCPVCREQLMREGSSDGMSNGSFGNRPADAGGADGADGGQRRGGGGQQADAAAQQTPAEIHARFFRGSMRCMTPNKDAEWGPLKVLHYVIGTAKGLTSVRELQLFDAELTIQNSNYDLWHVLFINLFFTLPNWEAQ